MRAGKWVFILAILILVGGGVWFFLLKKEPAPIQPSVEVPKDLFVREIVGKSVEGKNIEAYTYGTGSKNIIFIGGMHGGYEWNSVLLAYQFKDFLDANPSFIPAALSISIIPNINPDGVFKVVGKEGRFLATEVSKDETVLASARFNAHGVDLNRNFDCKWQPTSTWRSKTVSAGTSVFSEPEAVALRNFVLKTTPDAVVFWHSQANTVYASECENGILPVTIDLMKSYAQAAGYNQVSKFDAYPVTGDAEGWLAKINIPTITVELKTHETIEWEQNLLGIKAVVNYFNK